MGRSPSSSPPTTYGDAEDEADRTHRWATGLGERGGGRWASVHSQKADHAAGPGSTGTAGCVSDVGAFDMVGNLSEWVADWVPRSDGFCPGWGAFSDDFQCVSGALSNVAGGPGALLRGGNFLFGAGAGVFAVVGSNSPSGAAGSFGFRAAR